MKLLVQTRGEFQLLDMEGAAPVVIRYAGCTVVAPTNFVKAQIAEERLDLVGKVNDEATDEEWLKYVEDSGGDVELATSSFLSNFEIVA